MVMALLLSPKRALCGLPMTLVQLLLGPATVLRFTRRRASRYDGVGSRCAPAGGTGRGGSPPELLFRAHPRLSLALLSLPNFMVVPWLLLRMLLLLLLLPLALFSSLSWPNDRRRRLRMPPLVDRCCCCCGGCCCCLDEEGDSAENSMIESRLVNFTSLWSSKVRLTGGAGPAASPGWRKNVRVDRRCGSIPRRIGRHLYVALP